MLGILTEIIGFQQMVKLDSEYTSEISDRIITLLNIEKENCLISGNCIYCQFAYDQENSRKTWENIGILYDYLKSQKDEFQGFLILVDRITNMNNEEGFSQTRKKSYFIRETDTLVFTPRAEDICSGYFDLEYRGEYLALKSRSKWNPLDGNDHDVFYLRERLVDRIAGRLIPLIDDESGLSMLHFYGNTGIGKVFNIKKSIKKIREKSTALPLPVISGTEGLKAAYQEIMESLESWFLEKVPEMLLEVEKISWKHRNFLLVEGASDHGPRDMLLLYRLYIQAYCRLAERNNQPAYLICRDPHFLNKESVILLSAVFREFMYPGGIVPVVISSGNELPGEFGDIPCQRIRVTPLSLMEVEERLITGKLEGEDTSEVKEKTEGHVIYLSHFIILKQKGIDIPAQTKGVQISYLLLKQLELRLQSVLYAICIFPGLTDAETWAKIIEDNEIIHQNGMNAIKELKNFGFLSDDRWLRPVVPDIELAVSLSPEDKKDIEQKIARTGSSIWHEKKIFSVYSFLLGLKTRQAAVNFSRYFFDYTSKLLEQGQTVKGEALLQVFENIAGGEDNRDTLSNTVIHTLGLRSALMRGDRESARIRFLELTDISDSPLSLQEALNNLEAGRYLYAAGEYRQALDAVKKSLIFLQNEDNRLLTADANCQIGLIMLGMERLDEAAVYFGLGREQLNPEEHPHNYIKTIILEGLCQFIVGNLSQVSRLMIKAQDMAASFGRRELELYSIFILGRNEYEMGRYEAAEEVFIKGLLQSRLYFDFEKQKVFYSWIARCRIYEGNSQAALKILGKLKPDREVLFITAEALFFMGRREKALDALQFALEEDSKTVSNFCPGEYISWQTGFSSVEDRALRNPEGAGVLSHLIRSFRGYLWGKGIEKEEGRQELSRITRDERLGEEDPYKHYYFYLYNEIVPEMGDTEIVNKLTILSRSLKYLQQRASRIDETDDKKDYLYKNYWNSLIMKEGREQKIL